MYLKNICKNVLFILITFIALNSLIIPSIGYASVADNQIEQIKIDIENIDTKITNTQNDLSLLIKDSYKHKSFADIFNITHLNSYTAYLHYNDQIEIKISNLVTELKTYKEEKESILNSLEEQKKQINITSGWDESDFNMDKLSFINKWGVRIDNYLQGSPLVGYGNLFAEAAYNNKIDPRWSPAIATIESSKGTNCFKPYNAWGYGNYSWSNWEDSIVEHIKGLKETYGESITREAAKKYCPPHADNWYINVLREMESI